MTNGSINTWKWLPLWLSPGPHPVASAGVNWMSPWRKDCVLPKLSHSLLKVGKVMQNNVLSRHQRWWFPQRMRPRVIPFKGILREKGENWNVYFNANVCMWHRDLFALSLTSNVTPEHLHLACAENREVTVWCISLHPPQLARQSHQKACNQKLISLCRSDGETQRFCY